MIMFAVVTIFLFISRVLAGKSTPIIEHAKEDPVTRQETTETKVESLLRV